MSATDQSNILNRLELSHNLRGSLQRAAAYAYQQAHREVTVEHLLLSLAEDRDAAVILEASNVDVSSLVTEAADYLGRLDDRVEGEGARQPALGRDLIHIFQSAAAAAQKSQRRAVGSALVLAAIVGEGRSPSAQMLRNHGLTFEQAIAALRQANAAQAARAAQQPVEEPPPAAPPSEVRPAEAPDASPPSAAAAPLPSTPAPEPSPVPNVQAARDVLAGARQRVAQMGGPAASQQPAAANTEPAEASPPPAPEPAAKSDPTPKPKAPDRTGQASGKPAAEAARPAGPQNDNSSAEDAAPAVQPPPDKRPEPQHTPARDVPAKPPKKPAAVRPAPAPPGDGPPDKAARSRPPKPAPSEAANPAPPAPGPAAPSAPRRQPQPASDQSSADHAPPAPPPGAGGPPPQPPPAKRRPRWPDWAQQPGAAADAAQATHQQPSPDRGPAQRHPGANGPGPSHPGELRAETRQPGPPGQQPSGDWQPRHPAARAEAATTPRQRAPLARSPEPPPHAPAAPPQVMPDIPPFDPRMLVEQIPTRLRAGKPVTVNIRVPRRQLEAWSGGGPDPATHSQHVITKAMVMRLKASPKDFAIENASPETQWSEGYGGPLSDDIVSWRWVVTPRRSGRHAIQLSGSTRIVGRDGLAAERPLPPQRIPVRISPDYGRFLRRVAVWVMIAALAGAFGYFADGLFDMGRSVLAQLVR